MSWRMEAASNRFPFRFIIFEVCAVISHHLDLGVQCQVAAQPSRAFVMGFDPRGKSPCQNANPLSARQPKPGCSVRMCHQHSGRPPCASQSVRLCVPHQCAIPRACVFPRGRIDPLRSVPLPSIAPPDGKVYCHVNVSIMSYLIPYKSW